MKNAKLRRNDTCSCGSGKKYKQCCERKAADKSKLLSKWAAVILGGIILAGALVVLSSLSTSDQPTVQPGRVWSAEHNHWH